MVMNNLWSGKCYQTFSHAAESLDDSMIQLNKWEQAQEMPSSQETQGQATDFAFVTNTWVNTIHRLCNQHIRLKNNVFLQ